MKRVLCITAALLFWSAGEVVIAKEAVSLIANPAIEARMTRLTSQLRCLVCQGQSVAESDSGFSQDVRREIYKMIEQGKTDDEIVEFLVQRYGDFILFNPPVKGTTMLLWIGPPALLLTGAIVLLLVLRRRSPGEVVLSDEQIRRAEALLQGDAREDKAP